MYKLYDILLSDFIGEEVKKHLFYRGDNFIYKNEDNSYYLKRNSFYDLFTYFNSLSAEKWRKYTYATNFYIVLDIKGKFELELFGHYEDNGQIKKEWLGSYSRDMTERGMIVIPFPQYFQSSVVSFSLRSLSKVSLYDSYYAADLAEENENHPYISLVTTTFRKEAYVERNTKLLQNELFSEEEFQERFCWNIVDNGRTLKENTDPSANIKVFHNKNVGGAGGFARGMMESLKQKRKPTHILLMDDDVIFSPESFKRLYRLLNIIRPEYREHFISGAMLKMGQPNIQHEDTGKLNAKGYHEAAKPNLDLNIWSNVLINERISREENHEYAAWWFCCIPTTVARLDNLPLPVFVRGDDVEYSLRNQAKFITMNGICIWHEGFEGKFSAAMEYYQVIRNELILTAMHPELSDVDVLGHAEEVFWQEIYKFNYKGASLLLDAVEDFLKGPDYFLSLDLFEKLQEKRKEDNQLQPITENIRKLINYETLYTYKPVSGGKKIIYDYTYNGQARIPEFLIGNKIGIIPYSWGYFPGKQCLTKVNYAINPMTDQYVAYKKDRETFNRLRKRFADLKNEYEVQKAQIDNAYQNCHKNVTGIEFWENYLKKE